MRVLLTGGAGYVGSHATLALLEAGHSVVVLDDLSTGHRDLAAATGAPLVVGDVGDEALVRETIERHQLDAVMHFAAKALVGESVSRPGLYLEWNGARSARLFATAYEAGVRRFVASSTCAVYGSPDVDALTEALPLAPVNPYGQSKVVMEESLRTLGLGGARWCALRYFNAAGCDPALRTGERHQPETHLIPRLLASAAAGQHADVFGDDFPTPDGTAVRDYVHVADLADAHIRALERLDTQSLGPINLGTGVGVSVRQVAAAVRRVTGAALPERLGPRREGDPARLVAGRGKAGTLLGWSPRHLDLDAIVATAWAWYQHDAARRATP